MCCLNPFPQNEQFLLLPQCFPLLVIGYPFNYRDFTFFDKTCSVVCCRIVICGKGLISLKVIHCAIWIYPWYMDNPFPTYSKSAADNFENILSKMYNLYKWKNIYGKKVENIVTYWEIAHHEQFLILPQWF